MILLIAILQVNNIIADGSGKCFIIVDGPALSNVDSLSLAESTKYEFWSTARNICRSLPGIHPTLGSITSLKEQSKFNYFVTDFVILLSLIVSYMVAASHSVV